MNRIEEEEPLSSRTRSASAGDRHFLDVADVDHLADRGGLGHQLQQRADDVGDVREARDCVPSPKTVIGSPASAWRTKFGITMPYCPVWRGPTVLKKRTMMTGSLRSFQ